MLPAFCSLLLPPVCCLFLCPLSLCCAAPPACRLPPTRDNILRQHPARAASLRAHPVRSSFAPFTSVKFRGPAPVSRIAPHLSGGSALVVSCRTWLGVDSLAWSSDLGFVRFPLSPSCLCFGLVLPCLVLFCPAVSLCWPVCACPYCAVIGSDP